MMSILRQVSLVIAFILLSSGLAVARPLLSYQHVTNFERTQQNEFIWFWTMDTLYGNVHSNDYICVKYSPRFYGRVSTSRDRFQEFQASPFFEFRPEFNVPRVEFPDNYPHLIQSANLTVDSDNGELMTWITC